MGELIRREAASAPLPFSGERLTSGLAEWQVGIEHHHRYLLARDFCRGRDVLDVASGEGYGTALLAQVARSAIGVEIDPAAVAAARTEFVRPNLRYEVGDARALPLPDASIDVAVSFETLEHILEHDVFLSELHRVLRPGGLLVMSTPDRDIYSPAGAPPNPYHVLELTRAEFEALLRRHFAHAVFAAQRGVLGTVILGASRTITTRFFERRSDTHIEASDQLPRAPYLIALASDGDLPPLPDSAYIHRGDIDTDMLGRADAETRLRAAEASAADANRRADALKEEAATARAETEAAVAAVEAARARAEAAVEAARARAGVEVDAKGRAEVTPRTDQAARESAHQNALGQKDAEIAVLGARAAQAEEYVQAVLRSTSWHLTAPLRYLGSRSPTLARYARRALKLAWWTVTLRIHERYRSWRRARRAGTEADEPSQPDPPQTAGCGPGSEGVPQAAAVAAADPTTAEHEPKERFQQSMKEALRAFLLGTERITFVRVTEPDVSVLLILYNQAHFTLQCLQALRRQRGVSVELIIVDNGSTDETDALLLRIDNVKVLRNAHNEGFLLAVNRAAALATGRHLLLLNSDAFVRDGALAAALATLRSADDVGVVGCRIVLPTGRLQEAGSVLFNDGSALGYARGLRQDAGEAMFRRDVHFCSGAFLLTPRVLFNELGGLDTRYAPAYYEDADYCERVRAHGERIVYEPRAVIDHFEFGSEQGMGGAFALQLRNRKIFRDRHHAVLTATRLPPAAANVLFARDAGAGHRRLLFIDRQVPLQALGSGFPRARAMLAEFADAGWFVTFYPTFETEVNWDAAYREIPRGVEICDGRGHEGLAAFLAERRGFYDTIVVSRPENMRFIQAIRQARPDLIAGSHLIYDAEALFSARDIRRDRLQGRIVDRAAADALTAGELALCDGSDAVITVTPLEQSVFSAGQGAPVHVLSLPVAAYVHATPVFERRRGFLFVGRLLEKDAPNYDGLRWFVAEVWPRIRARLPDAELQVAGMLAEPHDELEAPGVRLLGPVADLAPLYDSARVFLAPTRFAAGVPIKVIEAVGAGMPVACTALIANQLGWTSGCELAVADDPKDLAEVAVALHESADRWQAMLEAAMQRIAVEHGSEVFRHGIRTLIGDGSNPTPPQDVPGKYYDPQTPMVSVIVLNWNKSEMTLQCLRHLHSYTVGFAFEIVVVDNGSRPEQVAILTAAMVPFRLIRLAHNRYFGEANNIGVEAARGAFVCFLNNDAFVQPGWLAPLMGTLLTQPRAGGAGPKFLYPDGRLQEAGALITEEGLAVQLGRGGSACDPEFDRLREVDYTSAATFLMRRDVFLRVLGFDLCWEPAYYEDVDLCLKIAALGLAIYYVPQSVVVHVEGATSLDPTGGLRLDNIIEINRLKLVARWGTRLVDRASVPTGLLPEAHSCAGSQAAAHGGPGQPHRVALFTPYHLTPGGGERHLLSIAVALAGHAHVTLVTPDHVSRIRVLTLGRELGLDLSALVLAAAAEIEGLEFDVGFVLGNELLPSIRGPGTRNVYLCQFPFPMVEADVSLRRSLWPQYEAVWVYSPFVERNVRGQMQQMQDHGIAKKPIEIIAPPVTMHPCREPKQAKILNVGRFFTGWHCKRQDLMIEAFARLVAEGATDAELHLAGSLHPEPENRAYLASLIEAAKGLPVFFHVNCSVEELAALYDESRIYWHATGLGVDVEQTPEKAEHFGITIVEAMSAGCVPIVHAAGGPMDLVEHGRTGYVFRSIDELCALTRPILADPNAAGVCAMAASASRSARAYSDARFADAVRARVLPMLASPVAAEGEWLAPAAVGPARPSPTDRVMQEDRRFA